MPKRCPLDTKSNVLINLVRKTFLQSNHIFTQRKGDNEPTNLLYKYVGYIKSSFVFSS
jgi:hypothetical protein